MIKSRLDRLESNMKDERIKQLRQFSDDEIEGEFIRRKLVTKLFPREELVLIANHRGLMLDDLIHS